MPPYYHRIVACGGHSKTIRGENFRFRPVGKRRAGSNNQKIGALSVLASRQPPVIPPHKRFQTIAPQACSGGRCFLLKRRYEYATATIVLLVLLRLAIGWHFFKEGVSHHTDRAWSSEGFLKQAKGPLADMYHSVLPDFHGWNRLMLAPLPDDRPGDATPVAEPAKESPEAEPAAKSDAEKPKPETTGRKLKTVAAKSTEKVSPDKKAAADKPEPAANEPAGDEKSAEKKAADAKTSAKEKDSAKKDASSRSAIYEPWLKAAVADWKADVEKAAEYYHFDEKQKAKANELVADAKRRMQDDLDDFEPDIRLYRQLLARAQAMSRSQGADTIPNEVARNAAAQQNPLGERGLNGQSSPLATTPAAWQSDAQAVEQLFHDQVRSLLTKDQQEMTAPSTSAGRLHNIDVGIGWLLMVVGGLLIVGLFTRVAAVVGALFLLSIICAQPPWLATSVQTYTYNQVVEMLALFALATTPVGRWGGLDYFLGLCCGGMLRQPLENRRWTQIDSAPRRQHAPGNAKTSDIRNLKSQIQNRKSKIENPNCPASAKRTPTMNLTPEERAIGKENFQAAIGSEYTRRDFLKGTLAATVAGAGLGAMYFGYAEGGTPKDPLRVGYIGIGDEGEVLLGALHSENTRKYIQVVAIADIRPFSIHRAFHGDHSSPDALGRRPGLMSMYGWKTEDEAKKHVKVYKDDYMDLINDPNVEAVVIALPLHLHSVAAIKAMTAKKPKHVITEKLMAHSVHECKEMGRVAKQTNRIFAVGHQRNYSVLYDNAKWLIRHGLLGDLHYIRAQWHRGNLPGHDSWQMPMPTDEKLAKQVLQPGKDHRLESRQAGRHRRSRKAAGPGRKCKSRIKRFNAEKYGYESTDAAQRQESLGPGRTDPLAALEPHRRRLDGRAGQPSARCRRHPDRRRARTGQGH